MMVLALVGWLLICFISGCDGPAVYHSAEEEAHIAATGDHTHHYAYEVITYDECQYVRWESGNHTGLAHKGNCTNPIHCHNEVLSVDTLRARRNREYQADR